MSPANGAVARAHGPFAAAAIWGSQDASTIVIWCWSRSLAGRLWMPRVLGVQLPVGSSAGGSEGELISTRAMATRCCCRRTSARLAAARGRPGPPLAAAGLAVANM